MRVSKGWERFLTSWPQLWMRVELDDDGTGEEIPGSAVQKYIRWSGTKLTHLAIKNLSFESAHQTLLMLSECSELEHLEFWGEYNCAVFYNLIKGLKNLRTVVSSSHISQEYIVKFFKALPQLQRVQFSKTTHSELNEVQWPSALPNLKRLSFDCHDQEVGSRQRVPGFHLPVTFVNRARRANYVCSPCLMVDRSPDQKKKKKKKFNMICFY